MNEQAGFAEHIVAFVNVEGILLPSKHPLVTRGMDLECADRYHALLTFLAHGAVRTDMFVRKRSVDPTQRLTKEEQIHSIEARVNACRCMQKAPSAAS